MPDQQYTIQNFLIAKSAIGPSLSAGGDSIAYLANLSGTFQIYIAPADGSGEAVQVTDYEDGISQAAFSPVSDDELVFAKDAGGNEMHQLYRMHLPTRKVSALTNAPGAMHNFSGWSRDGKRIAYSSNRRNGVDFDIYVLNLDSGAEQCVFDLGGWCSCFGFSPQGSYMIVSKAKSGGFLDTELYLVDLAGSAVPRLLTPHDEKAFYAEAEWLPDESSFYTVTNDCSDHAAAQQVLLKEHGAITILGGNWDTEQIAISPDGNRLAVVTNGAGYSVLTLHELGVGGHPRESNTIELPSGVLSGLTWSQDGGSLAFALSTSESSFNVWVCDAATGIARQLTAMPMDVPAEVMAQPELIHYRSFDGLSVPAFLYLPKNPSGGKLPAIVNIHGGPEGQFRPSFNPLIQYFVYRGYAVIAPNVRGSDGYGKRYLALDDREKRLDSVRDLEWLHRWIKQDGRIDTRRIALQGGSYGGYMVLAGLAFQPDLWAAGVDIVGIANLESFLENTSLWRRSVREAEYGYLATDREFLRAASPIHKAAEIRAPLFIIHGANDPRVPLSEAQQIRDKLAERGVRAELLLYYDEGHGLAKLKNRLDAYPRVADFLDSALQA